MCLNARMFPGVRLKLKGEAQVRWTESSGSGKNRRSTTYRGEEVYIREEVYLYGSRESSFRVINLKNCKTQQFIRWRKY